MGIADLNSWDGERLDDKQAARLSAIKYTGEKTMNKCSCSGCGCDHEHTHTAPANIKFFIVRLLVALSVVLGHVFDFLPEQIELPLLIAAYLLAGYNVLKAAMHNITHGRLFDENFLMTVASLGAFALGDMEEAVSVMIFYGIGELLQARAINSSRTDIAKLMDIRQDFANLKIGHELKVVSPAEVKLDDIIMVRPGEKVPLDGVVIGGESFVDTRALTGESKPQRAIAGKQVLAGMINTSGLLEVRVQKLFAESTANRILELVEHAQEKKAPSEQFITKFARYYTPFVVFSALSVALLPPLLGFGSFSQWLYRALTFLIVACPCALVISIPISFFGGIGSAARRGILVKGGNYLEALNNVDTVVFDKTGTLTYGSFTVTKIVPAADCEPKKMLYLAALAEQYSLHPIAKAICKTYGKRLDLSTQVQESAGMGVEAQCELGTILLGSSKFLENVAGLQDLPKCEQTAVHLALNNKYLGYLLIADEVKPNVRTALKELKTLGVRCIVMLTGDSEQAAQLFVKDLGLDGYGAGLLPQDKVREIERIMRDESGKHGKVIFVGDGINDAPVITRADVGVAMGGIGTDAAIEAADVVIMNDDIGKLSIAIKIAKKTRKIVMQNIMFSLGVKIAVMVLAFFGLTSMWFAIFADVGVALLAVLNALRAMRV